MSIAVPARACGIDFGTSNSTVGWLRPGQPTLIPLEDASVTLPSVVFFNQEERRPAFGRQALSEYLDGYEGRLMRSLKSLLGSPLLKSETTVLGSALPFKDLLGLFIGQLKQRAEAAAGREFEQVVLGRPVYFVDDDTEADQEAQNTLVAVAQKLGFKDVSFQFEPIEQHIDRDPEDRDLVLHLPDAIIVRDRKRETCVRYTYDFTVPAAGTRAEATTRGLPRRTEPTPPVVATEVMPHYV